MSKSLLFYSIFCVISGLSIPTKAQSTLCNSLQESQRSIAESLLTSHHSYDCCTDTIANCLERKPVCVLAVRLANNICRRIRDGHSKEMIVSGLKRRAQSATQDNGKISIDLTGVPSVGESDAPLTVVEYACPRCPFCAIVTPQLHDAIAEGPLQGKAKLYFKVFPIRGHQFATESGLAFVAAAKMGYFWEFLDYFFTRFTQYHPALQLQWVESVGMNKAAFELITAASSTRDILVQSKKEGILNGVNATPTFFIDGKKYLGDNRLEEIVDFLEEQYDRKKGNKYIKKASP